MDVLPAFNAAYTVFGHVIKGRNVVRAIERQPTDAENRPLLKCVISDCGIFDDDIDFTILPPPLRLAAENSRQSSDIQYNPDVVEKQTSTLINLEQPQNNRPLVNMLCWDGVRDHRVISSIDRNSQANLISFRLALRLKLHIAQYDKAKWSTMAEAIDPSLVPIGITEVDFKLGDYSTWRAAGRRFTEDFYVVNVLEILNSRYDVILGSTTATRLLPSLSVRDLDPYYPASIADAIATAFSPPENDARSASIQQVRRGLESLLRAVDPTKTSASTSNPTATNVCPVVGTTNLALPPAHPDFDQKKPRQTCPVTQATTDSHKQ